MSGNPAPSQWYPGPWAQTSLQLSCLPGFCSGHGFPAWPIAPCSSGVSLGCPRRSMHRYPVLEYTWISNPTWSLLSPDGSKLLKKSVRVMVSGKGLHISQCCLPSSVIVDTWIDLQTFPPHVRTVDSLERVNFASVSWSFWCSHPGAVQQNNFYNLVGGRLFKAQQLRSCLVKTLRVFAERDFSCAGHSTPARFSHLSGESPWHPQPSQARRAPSLWTHSLSGLRLQGT